MLSAGSFNQAIDELKAANQVSQQVLNLVERLAASNRAIIAEQASIHADAASAQSLEAQLAAQSDKFLTLLEDLPKRVSVLPADVAAVQQFIVTHCA